MKKIEAYAKAIAAAAAAFVGAYQVASTDGSVSGTEWLNIGVAVVIATVAVWGVKNPDGIPTATFPGPASEAFPTTGD